MNKGCCLQCGVGASGGLLRSLSLLSLSRSTRQGDSGDKAAWGNGAAPHAGLWAMGLVVKPG